MRKLLTQEQSQRVQCLRALACILLVAFHVIGDSQDNGMRVAGDSLWREFELFLTPLRMPLFTFLSGYIYAGKQLHNWAQWPPFIVRKAQRLWLPCLTLTPIFLLAQHLSKRGAAGDLSWAYFWHEFWVPNTVYWFLSALFLIFVVVSVWELYWPQKSARSLGGLLLLWWGLNVLQPIDPNVLGIGSALYLGPCFLAGIAARRYERFWTESRNLLAVTVCAAAVYTVYLYCIVTNLWPDATRSALCLVVVGVLLSLTLIRYLPTSRWAARLGHYSFSIFLFHIFFAAGSRLLLTRSGISQPEILFALPWVMGLIGPVLVEKWLRRWHWTRLFLLGQPGRSAKQSKFNTAQVVYAAAQRHDENLQNSP